MINTRKQLIKKLNKIDMKCLDEGMHFHDLRSLFESVEDRLTAEDRNDLKRMLSIEDDPEVIAAAMEAKLKEDYEEDAFEEPEEENIDEKDTIREIFNDFGLEARNVIFALDGVLIVNVDAEAYEDVQQQIEDEIFDNNFNIAEITFGKKDKETGSDTYDITILTPEYANLTEDMDFDNLYGDEDEIGNEVGEDESYDYFVVYAGDALIGEYPTYEDAKNDCDSDCVIKGVIQYGGEEFEETIIDPKELKEAMGEHSPAESLNESEGDNDTEIYYSIIYYLDKNDLPVDTGETEYYAKELENKVLEKLSEYEGLEFDFGDYDWKNDNSFIDNGWIIIPPAYNPEEVIERVNDLFMRNNYVYIDTEEGYQILYVEDAYEIKD